MAVDKLVDSAQLNSGLIQVANAIRAKGGTSESLAFPSGFVSAVEAIPSGGGTITDGIVIETRDENGYPTDVSIYGDLWKYALSYHGGYYHDTSGFSKVDTIKLMSSQSVLPEGCFYDIPARNITGLEKIDSISVNCLGGTRIESLYLPLVTNIAYGDPFSNNPELRTVNLPSASGNLTSGTSCLFDQCTGLETVTIGSVGHGMRSNSSINSFKRCTQTGLTITIYAVGSNVDDLVSAIRNGATNATIIIKASEATTYNGTSYAAGDTILTSEVTS